MYFLDLITSFTKAMRIGPTFQKHQKNLFCFFQYLRLQIYT
jgi:hypothetical protein